jgi:sugar phosphate isomerase/epimerase
LAGGAPAFELEALRRWGITAVELAQADLAGLSAGERARLQAVWQAAGLALAAVRASGPETVAEALTLAGEWGAGHVVAHAPPRETALDADAWLGQAAAQAEAQAVPLLIENHPGTWADTGQSLAALLQSAPAAWVGAAFDPAGLAARREHPFLTAWMPGALKTRIRLLRLADAAFAAGQPTRLNAGNAEIKELVSAMLARGFDGDFALAPLGPGAAAMATAAADAQALLAELGAPLAPEPANRLELRH